MLVTIDEDGRTRVRERYTVSAPVEGRLLRIAHKPGDIVRAGDVLARIDAGAPAPLDARTRAQLAARIDAAADGVRAATTRVDSARAARAQAGRDLSRMRQLQRDQVVAAQEVEAISTRDAVTAAELDAAEAGARVAQHELQAARAALSAQGTRAGARTVDVVAPCDGAVLRIAEESERVLAAGTPLAEIGATSALEVVVDLLSSDAVRISPGAPVLLERWGGEAPLNGRVRLIEPSSFTKVSALGVEEQRVNVVIDFTDPAPAWQRLGDGFALDVRVVVWQDARALKVAANALFRRDNGWWVFLAQNGRAVARAVQAGWNNGVEAEVRGGLREGDLVIVHPGDRVTDGGRIAPRRP